jgi:hypothetical protein
MLEVHATVGSRRPKRGNGEQAIASWLRLNGWDTLGWEPDTYDLPGGKALSPDTKLICGIYLEFTEADRYLHEEQLSARTKRKNQRHSQSRQVYISPAEYIKRKRAKIREAEGYHGITVVLVPWCLQQRLIEGSLNLGWLIALRIVSPTEFDSFIDSCLVEAA